MRSGAGDGAEIRGGGAVVMVSGQLVGHTEDTAHANWQTRANTDAASLTPPAKYFNDYKYYNHHHLLHCNKTTRRALTSTSTQ